MDALKGWKIINRADLREMAKPNFSVDNRIKTARQEYFVKRKQCNTDKSKYLLVKKLANQYNVREEIILEYF